MTTEQLIHWLPSVNASLNGLATVLLTIGFILIKRDPEKNRNLHRGVMLGAFGVSAIFLIFYVLHKFLRSAAGAAVNTAFQGEGIWAWIYYPMLLTHVVLAMVILPLILITLLFAIRGNYTRHRRWAKWTFPLWYYVSLTGVLVYFFLYHWFPPVG